MFAQRFAWLVVPMLLATANCSAMTISAHWISNGQLPTSTSCPEFTALNELESTFWFASGGCLLRARSNGADPDLFVGPNMVVEGIAATGRDHIWAVGINGKGKRIWGEIAEWQGGSWNRGRPSRWGLSDAFLFAGMESTRSGEALAFGQFTSSGDAAIARVNEGGWVAVSTPSLGKARLRALSFASDGCAWVLGRRPDGSLLIGKFNGDWQTVGSSEVVDDVTSVSAVSCDEAWFGGTALLHYREGLWERLQLPPDTLLRSVASCGGDSVLAAGMGHPLAGSTGDSRGVAFRVVGGRVESMEMEIPLGMAAWSIRSIACSADAIWAIAKSESAKPARATLPLLFHLESGVLRYRPWSHSRWQYYLNVLLR